MDDLLRKERFGDRVIEIYPDYDAPDPREWDNLGTMVCWHKRYDLGDQQAPRDLEDVYAVLDFYGVEDEDVALPVYIYDHSGITVSTSPFHSHWDSGQVGWIFVKEDDFEKEGLTWQEAEESLKAEVKTYDHYVRGDIYTAYIYDLVKCDKCGHEHQVSVDAYGGLTYEDVNDLIEEYNTEEENKKEVDKSEV